MDDAQAMSAADAVVLLHFGFLLFVVFGGLLTLWLPKTAWAHAPALAWGALVQFADWTCPLTYWEAALRDAPPGGSFIDQTVLPILYPDLLSEGVLTPAVRIGLGVALVALNAAIYALAIRRWRRDAAARRRQRAATVGVALSK